VKRFVAVAAVLVLSLGVTRANTIMYATAPGATTTSLGSTLPENATVTFITSANTLEIRVMNLQFGSGSVQQTISGIDWLLDTPTTGATVTDFSGGTINLVNPGGGGTQPVSYTAGAAYNPTNFPSDRWHLYTTNATSTTTAGAQINGGMELTTLSGGNPDETIIGPPNSSNLYIANHGLLGDNPFIQTNTSYVSWTIHFATGVTANTNVTAARLTFNTAFDTGTELNLIVETPEPESNRLIAGGLALLLAGTAIQRFRRRAL
jgi:hypothetical protein